MKKLLLIIFLLLSVVKMNAYEVGEEITLEYDDYSLTFKITSKQPAECSLIGFDYDDYYNPYDCPTTVTIPSTITYKNISVTSISDYAFDFQYLFYTGNPNLRIIEIPKTITSIDKAFKHCKTLSIIKCYAEEVPSMNISYSDFPDDLTIMVPSTSLEKYQSTSPWNTFNLVGISEDDTPYTIIDYKDYSLIFITTNTEPMECMVKCCEAEYNATIDIPYTVTISGKECNVTSIGERAFYMMNMTTVEIPHGITSIAEEAFKNSSIDSINIPNTVESMGMYAFAECKELTIVSIEDNTQFTPFGLGYGCFSHCSKLRSFKIPYGVTQISSSTFTECSNLTWVRIPNTVTEIGNFAFGYCSNLYWIYCECDRAPNISEYTFYHCNNIQKILVPGNSIGFPDSDGGYNKKPWNTYNVIEGAMILLQVNEPQFGSVKGGGLQDLNEELTVEAISNKGYLFNNWTEFDSIVSTERIYKFTTVSNRTLVANFIEFNTPSNLTAEAISTSEVSLKWNKVGNALSYNIYANEEFIVNTTSDFYVISDLKPYTDYYFSISAVADEAESKKSNVVCAKTLDLPISTPENLVAKATSTSSITLTWSKVKNALSYNIYQGEDMIANVSDTNYVAVNLKYNTEYCFTVTSVRNEQESENAEKVCIKTFDLPVSTPENLIAKATSTSSITLTWNKAQNALSYNIYNNDVLIANIQTTSYSINNLDYYTDYCYTISAVRNKSESKKSNVVCAKTLDLPISTPENLVAETTSTSSITLTWNMAQNALSYNIYQNEKMIANVADTNYVVEILDYNTEYCFTVTSIRNEQESEKSNSDCAKTLDLPISTPEDLVAEATSTSSITLTWNKVQNALSYNIYHDEEMIANVSDTNYIVENLECNTEYCFTVTSIRNEQESEKSNSDCAKTLGESIEELTSSLLLYPNPVNDRLYIETQTLTLTQTLSIEIYDIYGRLQDYRTTRLQDNLVIDVSNFKSGVYFVMIKTNDGVVTRRIVKQ